MQQGWLNISIGGKHRQKSQKRSLFLSYAVTKIRFQGFGFISSLEVLLHVHGIVQVVGIGFNQTSFTFLVHELQLLSLIRLQPILVRFCM